MTDETRITDPDTGGQKGQKLAQLGAIDPTSIMDVAKVAGFGATKYERFNYTKGYRWSLSYDALQRHLHAWAAGNNTDDESGLPHLAHAAWHCLTLLTFDRFDRGTDDRFPLREHWDMFPAPHEGVNNATNVTIEPICPPTVSCETLGCCDDPIVADALKAADRYYDTIMSSNAGVEAAIHFQQITDAWANEHHAHHYTQPCTPGNCCAAEGETVETYGT